MKVPETPLWLLSKKRENEALVSLQWLRGWVSPKSVENEFNEMKRYSESSNSCATCLKVVVKCSHPPAALREKIKELTRKRTIRPFLVVFFCFAVMQFSGVNPIRTYMVQIIRALEIPIDANWATTVVGIIVFVANIVCMSFVRVLGKRKMYFISLIGGAISSFALGMEFKLT